MRYDKLRLSREQLASFLKDPKAIREFERLIDMMNSIVPPSDSEAAVQAQAADSKAQDALDSIARLAAALGAAALLPAPGENRAPAFDYIDLPDDAPHVTLPRRIQWNRDDGTLDVGLYGGVVLQCGQELHAYVKNATGALIANGSAVMYDGVVGASGKIEVALAVADGSVDSNYVLGLATQDIPDGEFGYVTLLGLVRGFDATGGSKTVPEAWADGDVLFLDPAFPGEMTATEPDAPSLRLPVAVVIHAGSGGSGSVYARFKTGEALHSLHDVHAPAPRDLDLLQYNSGLGRWEAGALPWVDIDFPIIIRTTGVGIPTLATLNGNLTMPQWQVNDANVCESQELVHGWKEGSEVHWHLHLTTNGLDATDRYVRFELEYGYADVNGTWTFPAVVTTADLLIPANTPSKTMLVMSLAQFTPAVHIASHVVARLKRVAAVGAAPTLNPWIPMLQLHVQLDTMGSRNIGTK